MLFGFIAVYDFRRRRCVMELLGRIVQYPGVPLSEFLTAKHSKGVAKDKAIDKAKVEKMKAVDPPRHGARLPVSSPSRHTTFTLGQGGGQGEGQGEDRRLSAGPGWGCGCGAGQGGQGG